MNESRLFVIYLAVSTLLLISNTTYADSKTQTTQEPRTFNRGSVEVELKTCSIFYQFTPIPENLKARFESGMCEKGAPDSSSWGGGPYTVIFQSNGMVESTLTAYGNFVGDNRHPHGAGHNGKASATWIFQDGERWTADAPGSTDWYKTRETDAQEKKAETERMVVEAKRMVQITEGWRQIFAKGAQSMYLLAGKAQRNGSVTVNGQQYYSNDLYEKLIERFPDSEYAVKASDQLGSTNRLNDQTNTIRNSNYESCKAQRSTCLANCPPWRSGANNEYHFNCNQKCKDIGC